MASVQLCLDLGQRIETKSSSPGAGVWETFDDKTRDELIARLAALMASVLAKREEGHDE